MRWLPNLLGGSPKPQGEAVVIVSGLPRSGTSMMMKMLEAGGLPVMTDGERAAEVDNPKGYYEYERVKVLEKEKDKSYLRDARGKVLKVISFLLKELPDDNDCRIVFMRRDLGEVLASQNKMLTRRGEENKTDDAKTQDIYFSHLAAVRILSRKKPNWKFPEVRYDDTIENGTATAQVLNTFLGGQLDERKMAEAVLFYPPTVPNKPARGMSAPTLPKIHGPEWNLAPARFASRAMAVPASPLTRPSARSNPAQNTSRNGEGKVSASRRASSKVPFRTASTTRPSARETAPRARPRLSQRSRANATVPMLTSSMNRRVGPATSECSFSVSTAVIAVPVRPRAGWLLPFAGEPGRVRA